MNKTQELKAWYESLSPNSLERIDHFYTDSAYFKDPFNEFNGSKEIKKLFKTMFKDLDQPRFVFLDTIQDDEASFISWDFIFYLKGQKIVIHGSTHLKWINGKIYYHRDYWDVGEEILEKIPVIKSLYGILKRRLSH